MVESGDTGPWGLADIEAQLGKARNLGAVTRNDFIGGESEFVKAYGPFEFACKCRAEQGGIGGDLYLKACSPVHAALAPVWTP